MNDTTEKTEYMNTPTVSVTDDVHVQSFRSRSLDEACDFISGIFCPHDLKNVGQSVKADVIVRHAPLIDTSINFLSHGAPVEITPEPFKSFYLLQTPTAGSAMVTRGQRILEVPMGSATISAPDEEIQMEWSADCEKLILRIDRTTLETMYGSITGAAPSAPLRFEDVIPLTSGPMQSVWRMINMISEDLLENQESIFKSHHAMQHMEQSLLFALLNSGVYLQPNARSQQLSEIAPRQVRIVEEYIRENAAEPITIEQLVEVSGVSARTLFDNFRKFRGQTPMGYVKDVRLQCVRERLLNPKESDSVTSIAMRWGFSQLGRFAAIYKDQFGETPSQTLKRSQREA